MEHPAIPGFRLRAATADDCPSINAIYNFYVHTSPATFDLTPTTESWRIAWLREHSAAAFPVLVAVEDGTDRVAGWCSLNAWSPKGAYARTVDESIYIADAYRGRGLGRALVSAILEEARALGKHVVMAGVVDCQVASLGLHEALGFERSALNRHMGFKLGEWHDLVYLQRHLWRD